MELTKYTSTLFFAVVLTSLIPGGSSILCPPGLECQDDICLTTRGQTACCTCVDWDSKGACVIWITPQGNQESDCNFEADEPIINTDEGRNISDDLCPYNVDCEGERCLIVNGQPSCCTCIAWLLSGMCKTEGWRDGAGNACLLPSESSVSTQDTIVPPEISRGCPAGVNCEDTLCRQHSGANICCTCISWQSNGRCDPTGWRGLGGIGQCPLFTEVSIEDINREPTPDKPSISPTVSSGDFKVESTVSDPQDRDISALNQNVVIGMKSAQTRALNCRMGRMLCRALGRINPPKELPSSLRN